MPLPPKYGESSWNSCKKKLLLRRRRCNCLQEMKQGIVCDVRREPRPLSWGCCGCHVAMSTRETIRSPLKYLCQKRQEPSPSPCSKTESLEKPRTRTQSLPKCRSKTQSLKNPVAQKPSCSRTQSMKNPVDQVPSASQNCVRSEIAI